MEALEVDNRFNRAKELLTIIIGVLGTILGFYYGSLTGGESRLNVVNVASIIASATLESALWTSRSGRQID